MDIMTNTPNGTKTLIIEDKRIRFSVQCWMCAVSHNHTNHCQHVTVPFTADAAIKATAMMRKRGWWFHNTVVDGACLCPTCSKPEAVIECTCTCGRKFMRRVTDISQNPHMCLCNKCLTY
jgi:hypothetical protein